jgi:hypothetical protein
MHDAAAIAMVTQRPSHTKPLFQGRDAACPSPGGAGGLDWELCDWFSACRVAAFTLAAAAT